MALQMLPGTPAANETDRGLADSKLLSQFGLFQTALSNEQRIGSGELGVPIAFSECHSTPFAGIFGVFGSRPYSQMIGLAANGTVARVKNVQTWGDSPDENLIRDTVGAQKPKLAIDGAAELSVSMRAKGCGPVPASTSRWVTRHEPAKTIFYGQTSGPTPPPTSKRVAMTHPAFVMRIAEFSGPGWLIAEKTAHDGSIIRCLV